MQHLGVADWIVIAGFFTALLGLIAWVVFYAVWTHGDWRRTREGRHLMTFRSTLAVFMAMGVVNNLVTSYPGRDIVRSIVVTSFALAVIQGFRTLVLAQREGRELRRRTVIALERVGLKGVSDGREDIGTDRDVPEVDGTGKHAAPDVVRADHD